MADVFHDFQMVDHIALALDLQLNPTASQICEDLANRPGSKCNDYRAEMMGWPGITSKAVEKSDTPYHQHCQLIDLQIVYDIVYACVYCM